LKEGEEEEEKSLRGRENSCGGCFRHTTAETSTFVEYKYGCRLRGLKHFLGDLLFFLFSLFFGCFRGKMTQSQYEDWCMLASVLSS